MLGRRDIGYINKDTLTQKLKKGIRVGVFGIHFPNDLGGRDICPNEHKQVFEQRMTDRFGSFEGFQWDLQQKNGRPSLYARVVDIEVAVQYVLHEVKFSFGAGEELLPSDLTNPSRLASSDVCDPSAPVGEDESQFGFPNSETRKLVETAAVLHVTNYYESRGFKVQSRESENLGYDLDVIEPKQNQTVLKVEVKGTAGESEVFYITSNERKCASRDPNWRLAIVTCAVDCPLMLEPLNAAEMEERFSFSVVAWRSTRRNAESEPTATGR